MTPIPDLQSGISGKNLDTEHWRNGAVAIYIHIQKLPEDFGEKHSFKEINIWDSLLMDRTA